MFECQLNLLNICALDTNDLYLIVVSILALAIALTTLGIKEKPYRLVFQALALAGIVVGMLIHNLLPA